MILALLGAVAAAATVAVTFRVPLPAAGIVLLDVASLGALAGALIALTVAKLRGKPLPLRTLGVATVAALAGFAHLRFAPAAPAVIVMVVDCLRADRFADGKMPKVYNRLRDSVRFTRARSQSSWTRSAMPSLLSGRYPIEHGLFRTKPPDRIRSEVTMLAERFSDAGWLTGAFAEQAQLDAAFGYGRGFHRYGWHDGLAPRVNTKWLRWNGLFRTVPRFVLVHYIDVHGPYTPSKRFRPKNLPKANVALAPSAKWRTTIRKFRSGELALTTDDWARMRGLYDGEVRQIDTRIDAALGKLERDGTLDNAWFVFTADHGERFGEHDEIEHMGPPD
jgi:arylsulfatase